MQQLVDNAARQCTTSRGMLYRIKRAFCALYINGLRLRITFINLEGLCIAVCACTQECTSINCGLIVPDCLSALGRVLTSIISRIYAAIRDHLKIGVMDH